VYHSQSLFARLRFPQRPTPHPAALQLLGYLFQAQAQQVKRVQQMTIAQGSRRLTAQKDSARASLGSSSTCAPQRAFDSHARFVIRLAKSLLTQMPYAMILPRHLAGVLS
jgi:hypothetical protein